MASKTETALELDVEQAGHTRGEAVAFGGFPGVWEPGRPVAVSELGFDTDADALALVEELELPLRKVKVEAGSAPMPDRPNHVASQLEQLGAEEDAEGDEQAAGQEEPAQGDGAEASS